MAKYGKWIGGGLGWAFGGPIGALLGFAFGSMFDNMQSGTYSVEQTQAGDFAASLLVLSAAVMKADNRILKSELDYVKQFFVRHFGVEKTQQHMLMLREIINQNIPVQEVCMQIKQHMDHASRLQLLHFLFGIAAADSHIDPREVLIIQQIAHYLGVSAKDIESIKAMFIKDSSSAYKILEVPENATDEEIKKSYRRLAVKHHPDKVAHLGDDVQTAAKEKFQQITAAYETIKKQRGFN